MVILHSADFFDTGLISRTRAAALNMVLHSLQSAVLNCGRGKQEDFSEERH